MRKPIATLVLATLLSACGAAAASQPTGIAPTEDRSYDRIEALRAAHSTQQADAYDRIEELRSARSTQAVDSWDRVEQIRLNRSSSDAAPASRLRMLNERFAPDGAATVSSDRYPH